MENFKKKLKDYQKGIAREIKVFFDGEIKKEKDGFFKSCLLSLKEFSLRPAKRIRAILVVQGYLLAGGKKDMLKTAVFAELIHNFLLMHDDVMDQDKKRRGKPTMQYKYGGRHYGDSMAITLGDMIAALGYNILSSSPFPDELKNKAIGKLNETVYKTSYGQALELWASGRKDYKEYRLEIYKNKTANYTFVSPLQIGAILAGADDSFLKEIEKFGIPLGIAFQIKDDLMDAKKDKKSLLDGDSEKDAEKLINKAKKIISGEKYPKEQKDFLLDLADFILKRNG
jgi:geranylgeranyl diphosphate synthase type I